MATRRRARGGGGCSRGRAADADRRPRRGQQPGSGGSLPSPTRPCSPPSGCHPNRRGLRRRGGARASRRSPSPGGVRPSARPALTSSAAGAPRGPAAAPSGPRSRSPAGSAAVVIHVRDPAARRPDRGHLRQPREQAEDVAGDPPLLPRPRGGSGGGPARLGLLVRRQLDLPQRPARCARPPRRVPDALLLVETDAPFLAPQPVRGKPNAPANVVETAEASRARGVRSTPSSRARWRTTPRGSSLVTGRVVQARTELPRRHQPPRGDCPRRPGRGRRGGPRARRRPGAP